MNRFKPHFTQLCETLNTGHEFIETLKDPAKQPINGAQHAMLDSLGRKALQFVGEAA